MVRSIVIELPNCDIPGRVQTIDPQVKGEAIEAERPAKVAPFDMG
jgi:hypothetical protein